MFLGNNPHIRSQSYCLIVSTLRLESTSYPVVELLCITPDAQSELEVAVRFSLHSGHYISILSHSAATDKLLLTILSKRR